MKMTGQPSHFDHLEQMPVSELLLILSLAYDDASVDTAGADAQSAGREVGVMMQVGADLTAADTLRQKTSCQ